MARQPWSDAWVSRMEHRTRVQRGQSERERLLAEHRDFLLVAPISTVVGFEREHVFYNLFRDVAVLPPRRPRLAPPSLQLARSVLERGDAMTAACRSEPVFAFEVWLAGSTGAPSSTTERSTATAGNDGNDGTATAGDRGTAWVALRARREAKRRST